MSGRLDVLSLGAGVQSTTCLLMSLAGELPLLQCAVFADTRWEPEPVYKHLQWLTSYAAERGLSIVTVSAGDVRESGGRKIPRTMPIFGKKEGRDVGPMPRLCTSQYKVAPIRRYLQSVRDSRPVRLWMGISTDEAARIKPSGVKYIENWYPLIEAGKSRRDCERWLRAHGYEIPMKSSCIGCPYHSNREWARMQHLRPGEFQQAVEYDERARHLATDGLEGYLHRKLVPLAQAVQDKQAWLDDLDGFDEECDGMCAL